MLQNIVNEFNDEFKRLGWNIRAESYIDSDDVLEYSITFKAFVASNEKEYLDHVLFVYTSTRTKLREILPKLQLNLEADVGSGGGVSPFYIFPKISLTLPKGKDYHIEEKWAFSNAKSVFNRNCYMIIDMLRLNRKTTSPLIDVAFYIYSQWKTLYPDERQLHKDILATYLLLYVIKFPSDKSTDIIVNKFNGVGVPIIEEECLLGDCNLHHYSFRYVQVNPLSPKMQQWVDTILATYSPGHIRNWNTDFHGDVYYRLNRITDKHGIIAQKELSKIFSDIIANIEDIKQVIVVRKDLNMRKGKLAAQVAHASNAFLFDVVNDIDGNFLHRKMRNFCLMQQWISNLYKKIVVSIDDEQKLLDLIEKGEDVGLHVYPIYDTGLTEFHGQETLTCASFGPAPSKKLKSITGNLKLL